MVIQKGVVVNRAYFLFLGLFGTMSPQLGSASGMEIPSYCQTLLQGSVPGIAMDVRLPMLGSADLRAAVMVREIMLRQARGTPSSPTALESDLTWVAHNLAAIRPGVESVRPLSKPELWGMTRYLLLSYGLGDEVSTSVISNFSLEEFFLSNREVLLVSLFREVECRPSVMPAVITRILGAKAHVFEPGRINLVEADVAYEGERVLVGGWQVTSALRVGWEPERRLINGPKVYPSSKDVTNYQFYGSAAAALMAIKKHVAHPMRFFSTAVEAKVSPEEFVVASLRSWKRLSKALHDSRGHTSDEELESWRLAAKLLLGELDFLAEATKFRQWLKDNGFPSPL